MRLLEASTRYLQAKRVEGFSPVTLAAYALQHQLLARAIGDVPLEAITTQVLRDYLEATAQRVKPVTVGNRIRCLRGFFAWLADEEIVDRNPCAKIREPKEGLRVPRAISEEQLEIMREACRTFREHALVEFFFATGCRLNEVAQLDRTDLDLANRRAVVHGKGDRDREVYWGHKASIHLRRWLDSRRDDCPALFATVHRPYGRAARGTLYHEIKKVARRCGLEKAVSPHRLRHTLATSLLNHGADIMVVQSLLGHAKPETTLRYVSLSGTRRRAMYDRYFSQ